MIFLNNQGTTKAGMTIFEIAKHLMKKVFSTPEPMKPMKLKRFPSYRPPKLKPPSKTIECITI